jgi:hypothetical protein
VKGYCSDKAYSELALSLQCFGGSGYCQDFPIEQYVRDQKIDSLYEGTTHIQSLDLFFRKIAKDGGKTLENLMADIDKTASGTSGGDELVAERASLKRAADDLRGIYGAMMGKVGESLYHVGLQGNRILIATAELVVGWRHVVSAAVAIDQKAKNPNDAAFYDGKVSACRWWTRNVFPSITLTKKLVEQSSLDLMSMPDSQF